MKKILVADDEEAVRFVIKCALEDEGYEVITTEDGYDAINLIREEMPDLVILDMNMPQISGLEVTKMIRKEKITENIPIFISTGVEDIKSEFNGLDIQYFIPKPYDVSILMEKIKKVLTSQK